MESAGGARSIFTISDWWVDYARKTASWRLAMTQASVPAAPPTGGLSGRQGARPGPALVTVVLGLLLYFGLPRLMQVPDAKLFTGQPVAAKPVPATPAKPAPKPEARPTAPVAQTTTHGLAKPLTRIQAEAKAKAEVEAGNIRTRANSEIEQEVFRAKEQ